MAAGGPTATPLRATHLGLVAFHERRDAAAAEAAYAARRGARRREWGASSRPALRDTGDLEGAEAAFAQGDALGHGGAAANLGVSLHERGEVDEAAAAFARADERGHPGGAFNLGVILEAAGTPRAPWPPTGGPTSAARPVPTTRSGGSRPTERRPRAQFCVPGADDEFVRLLMDLLFRRPPGGTPRIGRTPGGSV